MQGRARAASLHQRASLLQLGALDMLRSDPAVPSHRDSCLAFLSAFFVPPLAEGRRSKLHIPIMARVGQ
jgi:hypothetical protein